MGWFREAGITTGLLTQYAWGAVVNELRQWEAKRDYTRRGMKVRRIDTRDDGEAEYWYYVPVER